MGVPMIFDFGLTTMQCTSIDIISTQIPLGTKNKKREKDNLRPVSLPSRGITCFIFTTAPTQCPKRPEKEAWPFQGPCEYPGVLFGNSKESPLDTNSPLRQSAQYFFLVVLVQYTMHDTMP
jgi:hypothetical protein